MIAAITKAGWAFKCPTRLHGYKDKSTRESLQKSVQRAIEITTILREDVPGQLGDPIEIISDDLGFGTLGVHLLKPGELT